MSNVVGRGAQLTLYGAKIRDACAGFESPFALIFWRLTTGRSSRRATAEDMVVAEYQAIDSLLDALIAAQGETSDLLSKKSCDAPVRLADRRPVLRT